MKAQRYAVAELAGRWSRDKGLKPAEEIETDLWRAYWKGELNFVVRAPNSLSPHFEWGKEQGKETTRRRVPSDEFRPMNAEALLRLLPFLAPPDGQDDKLEVRRERALALTARELHMHAEASGKRDQLDKFYAAYLDGAAIEQRALRVWCTNQGFEPPSFWPNTGVPKGTNEKPESHYVEEMRRLREQGLAKTRHAAATMVAQDFYSNDRGSDVQSNISNMVKRLTRKYKSRFGHE